MKSRFFALLCLILIATLVGQAAHPAPLAAQSSIPVTILSSDHAGNKSLQTDRAIQIVRDALQLDSGKVSYSEARVKVLYNTANEPESFIVYLLQKDTYLIETAKIALGKDYSVISTEINYQEKAADTQDATIFATCPNTSVQMVFSTCETGIPTAVAAVDRAGELAAQAGYTYVILKGSQENVAAIQNWLSCPNLIAYGRVGHGNTNGILLYDGTLSYTWFQGLSASALNGSVLYFNSCQVHNSPLEPAIVNAGVQKFIGGNDNLYIGPSEDVFKCFWEDTMDGANMTPTLSSCEVEYYPYTGAHGISPASGSEILQPPVTRNGMTWGRLDDPATAIEGVGCEGCNPYQGDTSCSSSLPILCIKPEGEQRENYDIAPYGGSMPAEYYRGWAGGHIKTTSAVPGTQLTSLAAANALCASAFGSGYRMAEFHDGKYKSGMDLDLYYGSTWPTSGLSTGGWNFYGYGNLSSSTRFWTYINDQSANCWNSSAGKGMTWKRLSDPTMAIEGAGCGNCNPYHGDTSCATSLPVLCIKPEGERRENYDVAPYGGSLSAEYYRGWAGGHIKTTSAVPGTQLTSLATANALCASTFGSGYRMAEFHDGKYMSGMDLDLYYGSTWSSSSASTGGWNFYGYGSLGSTRFWTYINDQPANCWNN